MAVGNTYPRNSSLRCAWVRDDTTALVRYMGVMRPRVRVLAIVFMRRNVGLTPVDNHSEGGAKMFLPHVAQNPSQTHECTHGGYCRGTKNNYGRQQSAEHMVTCKETTVRYPVCFVWVEPEFKRERHNGRR